MHDNYENVKDTAKFTQSVEQLWGISLAQLLLCAQVNFEFHHGFVLILKFLVWDLFGSRFCLIQHHFKDWLITLILLNFPFVFIFKGFLNLITRIKEKWEGLVPSVFKAHFWILHKVLVCGHLFHRVIFSHYGILSLLDLLSVVVRIGKVF